MKIAIVSSKNTNESPNSFFKILEKNLSQKKILRIFLSKKKKQNNFFSFTTSIFNT